MTLRNLFIDFEYDTNIVYPVRQEEIEPPEDAEALCFRVEKRVAKSKSDTITKLLRDRVLRYFPSN